MKMTTTEIISSRPIHIRSTTWSFAVPGRGRKLFIGPTMPNPGPMFPSVAIVTLILQCRGVKASADGIEIYQNRREGEK